jgi:hypothetical protein
MVVRGPRLPQDYWTVLELAALRQHPDLLGEDFSGSVQAAWPESMQHNPTAQPHFGRHHLDTAFARRSDTPTYSGITVP